LLLLFDPIRGVQEIWFNKTGLLLV